MKYTIPSHGPSLLVHAILAGALILPASTAMAADKYANQETSYVKPAATPPTEQVQSPRDPASGQATSQTITFTDIVISSATAPSNPPRQSILGDTATHEAGHRSAPPAGDAPAEIYSNNIGGGLLGVQAGQAGVETYREGGVNDTTYQRSAGIQSPRDPASGQATGVTAQYNPKELGVDKIQSPRDLASGQATARTAAPKSAKGVTFEDILVSSATAPQPGNGTAGGATGASERSVNPDQPKNFSLSSNTPGSTAVARTETVNANETVNAAPGASDQFIGGTGDGQGIRKPRPNKRPRKGRRMHKP